MPKLDLDNNSLYEPIQITMGGNKYTIEKLTEDKLQQLQVADENIEENKDPHLLSKQVEKLLDAEQGSFRDVDVRMLGGIVKFVVKCVNDVVGDEGKK